MRIHSAVFMSGATANNIKFAELLENVKSLTGSLYGNL